MCGITGAIVFRDGQFRITPEYIARMRDTMVHRGPDGAGVWVSPDARIGLGHRRLSIIDLSNAAAQPMSTPDDSIWISFNGEIYNHADIRRELVALGHTNWKTDHSDTEMILRAFEQWGIACVERFRGMFAIALWDARKKELWLIRDRIGVKPLYYSVHNGRLTFASEIKALLEDPDQPRRLDEEAFYHYLSFLTTPAPMTMFAGIRKLPGGTWMKVSADGRMEEQRYWDVWDHTQPLTDASEDEIAERILAELRTAVKLRKVSDVPVGVFLSGGIDSSTNAALFSEGEKSQVKTFTIGYEGKYDSYTNELNFAQQMADVVHADHHVKLLTVDDLISFLPQMVHLQDEPIADPVCVPVYYVSKLARDNGVIVCQVGEGSDELFFGYPYWRSMLKVQEMDDLPIPRWVKKAGLGILKMRGGGKGFKSELLRRGSMGHRIFWGGAEAFSELQKKQLISERLRNQYKNFTSWEALRPLHERFMRKAWEPSNLNWMTHIDLHLRLPELLLMRVDKMSMGVSLEGRVPFLDHKFVELAMSIPTKIKRGHGQLKHILKKSVRGVIPDNLIDRPKQGFGVPVYEWFFDRLGDMAKKEVRTLCETTDLFDRAEIERMLSGNAGAQLWYILNFALWHKEYIQR